MKWGILWYVFDWFVSTDSREYHPQCLPDLQVTGVVLQRFPVADRKETALPGGIELVSHQAVFLTVVQLRREDITHCVCFALFI